jgi:hypothetical protein
MESEAEVVNAARHSYDQFLLALKIESASNVFGVLVVAVAFYFLSDQLYLRIWFQAAAVAFAAGALTGAIAYLLVVRARQRLASDALITGQGGTAAPAGAEDQTRAIAAILALVSMFLFSIGSTLPIIGWFWY